MVRQRQYLKIMGSFTTIRRKLTILTLKNVSPEDAIYSRRSHCRGKSFQLTRTIVSIFPSINDPMYAFVGAVYQTQRQISEDKKIQSHGNVKTKAIENPDIRTDAKTLF